MMRYAGKSILLAAILLQCSVALGSEESRLVELARNYAIASKEHGKEFEQYFQRQRVVNRIEVHEQSNVVAFIHHGVAYDGCSFALIVIINKDGSLNKIVRNDLGCADGP
jgi:hypothetical protein